MLDTENDPQPTDPPDNTGGGDTSPETTDSKTTDPPDNTGGGGTTQ